MRRELSKDFAAIIRRSAIIKLRHNSAHLNLIFFFSSLLTSLFIFFFYFGGFSRLNPRNFQWISGDNSLSYIAQLFFLTDKWRFPLGSNPNYGLELSTSLTYTSPPLPIMLLQKILGLPPELQFVGFWLLVCLFLQVYIGSKIANELGGNLLQSTIFGVLQITPFLLMRMEIHYWLIAHFLILWSVLIVLSYLKGKKVIIFQVVCVLFLAYTIHGYLLLFSILLFFVICIREFTKEGRKFTQLSKKLLIVLVATPFLCSLLIDGFGSTPGSLYEKIRMNFTGQYSFYPSNLIAPLNPAVGFDRDCSKYHCMYGGEAPDYVVDNFSITSIDLGSVQGNEDGYLYLGAGLLFFVLFVFVRIITLPSWKLKLARFVKEWLFILVYFGLIFLFSITNRITFGSNEITLPIPKWVRWGLSIFRGTGRFNWVIVYVALGFLFFLSVRYLTSRTLSILLILVLSFQVVDVSTPIMNRFKALKSAEFQVFKTSPELVESFTELAQKKLYMRMYPSSSMQGFPSLAYLAWKNGLATNQAQSARFNYLQAERSDRLLYNQICFESFPPDTLVVIPLTDFAQFSHCGLSKKIGAEVNGLIFLSD